MIHEPNTKSCLIASRLGGNGISPTFFPRLKIQMPLGCPGSWAPQAATTLSVHVVLAVMTSGVWGLVIKASCKPRRRSYVCRLRPMEVVTWNVVLPRGSVVKGTVVGETNPIVCSGQKLFICSSRRKHTLNGEKIFDCLDSPWPADSLTQSFWRLTTGPWRAWDAIVAVWLAAIMVISTWWAGGRLFYTWGWIVGAKTTPPPIKYHVNSKTSGGAVILQNPIESYRARIFT